MTVCVFLGPTLARPEAEALLEARCLPPARRGDIAAAVTQHGAQTIGLIDGFFEQVPAVWHKEILWALAQGVRVAGAASMGALRAAELSQFGMEGVGRIFEAYRSGRFEPYDEPFEDDDEVAVAHGPAETGYAATEAMVDIRATLAAAEAAGLLDRPGRDSLVRTAKALFYKHRTWPEIFDAFEGGPDPLMVSAVKAWLPDHRVPQKRRDAAQLLCHLAQTPPPPLHPFRFERTLLWERHGPVSQETLR
ncbi:MAG: TfuA-like protein [Pseudomonadota bacterium]